MPDHMRDLQAAIAPCPPWPSPGESRVLRGLAYSWNLAAGNFYQPLPDPCHRRASPRRKIGFSPTCADQAVARAMLLLTKDGGQMVAPRGIGDLGNRGSRGGGGVTTGKGVNHRQKEDNDASPMHLRQSHRASPR